MKGTSPLGTVSLLLLPAAFGTSYARRAVGTGVVGVRGTTAAAAAAAASRGCSAGGST